MPRNGPKSVGFCLPTDLLQRYTSQQQAMTAWQSVWCRCVPTPLSLHTRPVRFEHGKLTVSADAAIWASQLRHQLRRLTQSLQQHTLFAGLNEIRVRVRPPATQVPPGQEQKTRHRPVLSTPARRLLSNLAESINDPELSESLKKLSESKR